MARIGGCWQTLATLPGAAASVVSDAVAAVTWAYGDGLWADQFLSTRSAVGSGQQSRWRSETWNPGDSGDVHANWKLKLQFDELGDRLSLLEG